jgi:hypothetical protein
MKNQKNENYKSLNVDYKLMFLIFLLMISIVFNIRFFFSQEITQKINIKEEISEEKLKEILTLDELSFDNLEEVFDYLLDERCELIKRKNELKMVEDES